MISTTIKAKHLDDIEAGIKQFEYRAYNEFWRKLIEGKDHSHIVFISGRRVRKYEINRILIIPSPEAHRALLGTAECFSIKLGRRVT